MTIRWVKRENQWRKWFAWYPVKVSHVDLEDGTIEKEYIWLGFVERIDHGLAFSPQFREIREDE